MRKILAIVLTLTMACMLLTGCGKKSNDNAGNNDTNVGSNSESDTFEIAMITD